MKKHFFILFVSCTTVTLLYAQNEKAPLWEGNKFYKELNFQKSLEAYNKALAIAPANPLANYNMGNTQFRLNKFDEAAKMYDNTISHSDKKPDKEKAFYNKGVSFSKQKKLDESITAYKEALKLDPNDQEARENLQKALLEKKEEDKKKQGGEDKKEEEKKDPKNKNDKKDKEEKKQDQQQDKQTKLSKQQVEQLLKALEQKEKEVQKKMQDRENEKEKQKSAARPDKDW